jgi:hypothetical protein
MKGYESVPTTAFSSQVGARAYKKGFKVTKSNWNNHPKAHHQVTNSMITVNEILKAKKNSKIVILKDKLSKRAKLRLELENVIKMLKNPSNYLKNLRNGCEDKKDAIIRKDLLAISQSISCAMASKRKSLDTLFTIAKCLYKLEDNFTGSKELRLYLKKLVTIIERRIEGLYRVKNHTLQKQKEMSKRSTKSPEAKQCKQKKDLEYSVMNLCENYANHSIDKEQMRKSLKMIVNKSKDTVDNNSNNNSVLSVRKTPRLLVPVAFRRSTTPNSRAWSKIHDQFENDKSLRNTPTLTNRSRSNLSAEGVKSFRVKRSIRGKLQYKVKGEVGRDQTPESKAF